MVKPIPANLRNYLGMLDVMEGKGPIYMRTEEAIQKIAEQADDEKAFKKKMKELEAEAWEDFLDMTISQAILWAATNTQPEEKSPPRSPRPSRTSSAPTPAPPAPGCPVRKTWPGTDYFWGYENMSTVKGLFCAGDASGASSHKFSSGSHAEGRIAGKAAIRYLVNENPPMPTVDDATIEELKTKT
jgi:adenylylsulfate reductase subunit A